ncbi:MAG: Fic family protein [Deltaproteobacteria bacterium]|nr:Fic family protein [Deltaproteobacteria bacterium]
MQEPPAASPPSYVVQTSPELQRKLRQADQLKADIDQKRPLHPDLWATILKKSKVDWTYDSNAIEGSTLTRSDTFYLLEHGITVQGKPLKDFLDARNHAEAVDLLYDVVRDQRPISAGLIKELNALLLSGVRLTTAISEQGQRVQKPATPGAYKKLSNHVLQPDGTIHHYAEPLEVPLLMDELVTWVDENIGSSHPALVGAVAHYNMVRIHPFDDGNGRGARILMNLLLMRGGFLPAIIRFEERERYIETIVQADKGQLNPFVSFMLDALIETQEGVLADLSRVGDS